MPFLLHTYRVFGVLATNALRLPTTVEIVLFQTMVQALRMFEHGVSFMFSIRSDACFGFTQRVSVVVWNQLML